MLNADFCGEDVTKEIGAPIQKEQPTVNIKITVGTEAPYMRREVVEFATSMEYELRLNDHKGSWAHIPLEDLIAHLDDEVRELKEAMALGYSPSTVLSEASDTANMAMMIADNYSKGFIPKQ